MSHSISTQESWFTQRYRKIHLDFHTPSWGTLENLNVDDLVANMVKGNVNAVVIFTKCHFGNSYYPTRVGHVHPSLKIDYVGEAIEKLHAQDIKVIAYHSVGWDAYAGKKHPDWIRRDEKGNAQMIPWANMCFNSPYKEELLIPQLEEIARNYNPEAYWLDIVHAAPCYCDYCKAKFRAENRKELTNGLEHEEFQRRTVHRLLREIRLRIKSINPEALIGVNGLGRLGSDLSLAQHVDYLTLESQPFAGYDNNSFVARYARTTGKPFELLTVRFYTGWGHWTLKPLAQMKYEFAQIMMNGGLVSCGDQHYFDGRLEPAVYERIGQAYGWLKEREDFAVGAESVPYMALLGRLRTRVGGPIITGFEDADALRGAHKALVELHQQYDIIVNIEQLNRYKILVLPDVRDLSDDEIESIKTFVREGGRLLATYKTSQRPGEEFRLADCFGVSMIDDSPYSMHYIRLSDEIQGDIPNIPWMIVGGAAKVEAVSAKPYAELVYPIIEPEKIPRMPPPGDASSLPAITVNEYGKGKVIYISSPIFASFWQNQHTWLKLIVGRLISLITGDAPFVIDAPPTVEANLTRKGDDLLLHLLNYQAVRATRASLRDSATIAAQRRWRRSYEPIEEICPLHDIPVKVKTEARSLIWEPEGIELTYEEENGYLSTVIPKLEIHGILRAKK